MIYICNSKYESMRLLWTAVFESQNCIEIAFVEESFHPSPTQIVLSRSFVTAFRLLEKG